MTRRQRQLRRRKSKPRLRTKAGLDAKGIVIKAFEALGQNVRGEAVKLGRA